jgi:F-type H+-transporting ATPase subunit b
MVSLSFDWSLLVQIANFLILILILNKILYQPVRKLMTSRQELIESLKRGADAVKERLAEGEAAQERFRVEVLQEGVNILKASKDAGGAKELEILTGTQREAAERLETARRAINQQTDEARGQLRAQAGALADEIVGKLLGRLDDAE